jgi:hypothetical protein
MKVVIDPSEDLFSYPPHVKQILTPTLGDDEVHCPINPSNANLGFSMFNGNITRRPGKRMSVYQLLLDSQLELRRSGSSI